MRCIFLVSYYGWIGGHDELWLFEQGTFTLLVISDAD